MGKTNQVSPRCSIVIRAFNEENHIGRLLAGIIQQSYQDFEIILVDSGSTDATVAIASRFPVEIIHIQPKSFTFGYSLNKGIAAGKGEFVVIASAHVYPVYPDWLGKLVEPFQDSRVGLVYGKQRGDSNTKFSERQIFKRWFPEISQPRQAHPFCNNANAAIRRELWERHPYDETLTGLEDLAWAKWVLNEGFAITYSAEAEIVHVHDETPRKIFNRYRREAMAFQQIFPDEKFTLLEFFRLLLSNISSDLWQAARSRTLRRHWRSIFWFRWMQFFGTFQGYRTAGPLTAQLRQTFYYPPSPLFSTPIEEAGKRRKVEPIHYHETHE